ncbi:MAG: PASTA domain-containing protein [Candidatus Rokuibacteriota bacterium]
MSYASVDRERARLIAGILESQGWSVWWDRTIPPGSTFDRVIEQALDSARCVVVLWSKASAVSDWVKTEAAEAARRKILVPALIEDVRIPLEFRRLQAANLSDWQEGTDHPELTTLFRSIADYLAPAPRDRAPERLLANGSREETSERLDAEVPATQRGVRLPGSPPPRPGFGRRAAAIAAAVLAAAGIAGGWFLWRPNVVVPDVTGLQAERAQDILQNVGLTVGETSNKEAAGSVPGTVLSHSPAAREKARKGQSVSLVVATPARIPVPNVQGRTLEQARIALERAGFTVGRTTIRVTDEASPGVILNQRPEAGSRSEKATTVDLVIAARQLLRVPDLVGLTLRDAQTRLEREGLVSGRVDNAPAGDRPAGSVLRQKPAAGEQAEKGRAVDLVVATEATQPHPPGGSVLVPDVTKRASRDAAAVLKDAGLLALIRESDIAQGPVGTVVSQRPPAGASLERAKGVTLIVRAAPPPTDPAGNSISGLIWKTAAETDLELEFRVVYTYKGDKGRSGVVIFGFPLTADNRAVTGLDRFEQPVNVGTGHADLKISRKPGSPSTMSNQLRVCMANREQRVSVFCRTYEFGKIWR